jgi:cell volume regulation protein A
MPVTIEIILLLGSVLILFSVFASKLSEKFAVPSLLLFLIIGMLAGSEGIGGIYFDDPWLAKFIGIIALVLIIFLAVLIPLKSVRPLVSCAVRSFDCRSFIYCFIVGLFGYLSEIFFLRMLLGSIVFQQMQRPYSVY